MKKRVYTLLVEHFKNWGISHVFGIPGKSISPLMLELESHGIQYVLGRHEAGSGFEASGYALAKKTMGIAIGTSGPGGTNLITAAGQAKEFQLPVLFITGQPSMRETGRALSQDSSQFGADLVKMFEPVTLFSARIERGDLLYLYLKHALEKAYTGEKGPVHLCIPFDVLMEEVESFYLPLPDHISPVVSPDIDKAISMLGEAKKPVLFLGKGAVMADAYEPLRIMAEHWGIPVMTTPGAKGAFPTSHPLYLGGYGLGGSKHATDYMRSGIDLMIVVGSKLCDMSLSGFTPDMEPEKVLQFEYDLKFAGKTIQAPTQLILGDIRSNLTQLISQSGASSKEHEMLIARAQAAAATSQAESVLSAGTAFRSLRSVLPKEAVLFGDAGSHSFHAVQNFEIIEPGTFYFDEVFIAMGAAIGYSIGAKIAMPDRPVVCVTGDGCIMMHGTEISTAVNHGIPVIFFVLNNCRLDMVEKGMSYNTGRSVGAVYERPLDVSLFAQSMGAMAFRCENEADITRAVQSALQSHTATVIEVMVDPQEIPPILTRLLSLD
ncbi:thiamine pyrophosphate-binding protein [Paenibacillus lactis]|uniref:Thiamine pyrophosphate central domain-containing protein n=2 Tax=Paenibacillus lactis TaxID=228574 RepID=G4HPZ7_9BACL|nr:thiamine pyrophosphate-binding protein [Paenibacillus lactis]EHB46476.1 thiamine pyrophosphate central domain-containing protein [Paenibacillus lactis 154]MBP1896097.1 acetolactate synthase-1/2/3 large subunit [Paenibacillus lactis]HAF99928.1 thiamine pyrophosphate-binding protein [Paenibacillus lactis]